MVTRDRLTGSNLDMVSAGFANSGYTISLGLPQLSDEVEDRIVNCLMGITSGASRFNWTTEFGLAESERGCQHVIAGPLVLAFIGSGASGVVGTREPASQRRAVAEPDYPQMLSQIRARLGLNMSQLAQALCVGRPTVYAWLRREHDPQEQNRRRIRSIWQLASHWAEQCAEPLGTDWERAVTEDDYTVAQLMAEENLRKFVLEQALRRLASERETAKAMSLGERLAAKRGMSERRHADADQDFLTGRRLSED